MGAIPNLPTLGPSVSTTGKVWVLRESLTELCTALEMISGA